MKRLLLYPSRHRRGRFWPKTLRPAKHHSENAPPIIVSARTPPTRLDRRLTGLIVERLARLKASATPMQTRIPASPGTRKHSRNTSKILARRFRAPR